MGFPAANVGQSVVGTCYSHDKPLSTTGIIVQGAATVMAEGSPAARVGDTVALACGHSAVIVSGSPTVFAEGVLFARLSDSVGGVFIGNIVSGCATVTVA